MSRGLYSEYIGAVTVFEDLVYLGLESPAVQNNGSVLII
jgi:hypothetical protein